MTICFAGGVIAGAVGFRFLSGTASDAARLSRDRESYCIGVTSQLVALGELPSSGHLAVASAHVRPAQVLALMPAVRFCSSGGEWKELEPRLLEAIAHYEAGGDAPSENDAASALVLDVATRMRRTWR